MPRCKDQGVFDHVTIRVSDRPASATFYATVLEALGVHRAAAGGRYVEWGDLSIAQCDALHPATSGLHLGLVAPSTQLADAFWLAGVEAGYRSDGEPGPRALYGEDYYGAFLLDPDGNSVEAARHDGLRTSEGTIDHLWMRVANLDASRQFYETIAPHGSFSLVASTDRLARFRATEGGGSLTVVQAGPGEAVTRHVHLAFPAIEDAVVDAFHAAATGAGHPDNGGPGERAEYHRGYYGAFVLDPDGNNVEVVHHGGQASAT